MPQEEEISSESECDWEEVPENQAPKEVQVCCINTNLFLMWWINRNS